MDEAEIGAVAAALHKVPAPEDVYVYGQLLELVQLARQHGNDCGLAVLAGLWLGQGKPMHEIVARLWPHVQRFTLIEGDAS